MGVSDAVNLRDPHGSGVELSGEVAGPCRAGAVSSLGTKGAPSPRTRHFPGTFCLFLLTEENDAHPSLRSDLYPLPDPDVLPGRPCLGLLPPPVLTGECLLSGVSG